MHNVTSRWRRLPWGCLFAPCVWLFTARAPGGECAFTVSRSGQAVIVTNPLPRAVVPTVHIQGVTEPLAPGVRFTENPALNGLALAGRLLTGSTLTLQPNGIGVWRYDAGFNAFQKGRPLDQCEHPGEYVKHRWDACGGRAAALTHTGSSIQFLRLRQDAPVCYPLDFSSGLSIRTVRVVIGYRRIEACGSLRIRLTRDRAGTNTVGEYVVTRDGVSPRCGHAELDHPAAMPGQQPVGRVSGLDCRFTNVDATHAWLHLSVERDWALVGPLNLTAWLDTRGVALPELQPGRNRLIYTDGTHSSHRANGLLTWPDAVSNEHVLATFETGLEGWAGNARARLEHSQGAPGGAHRGQGYLSVTLQPTNDGAEAMATLSGLSKSDWRDYDRLEFSLNAAEAPESRLRIGFYSRPEGYSCLAWIDAGTGNTWKRYSIDISRMGRGNVRWLRVGTYGPRWSGRKPYRLLLDDLRLVRRGDDAPAAVADGRRRGLAGLTPGQQAKLKANVVRWLQTPPPDPAFPEAMRPAPAEACFPMGVWGLGNSPRTIGEALGLEGWDGFKAVLHDLRAHNMNAIAGSGHPFHEDDGRYFDLLEAAGMRSWLYGPRYFHDQGSPEKNRVWFESQIAPAARRLAPVARGRRGLLAWCFNEEIKAQMVPDLKLYYDLMRELAPDQSIVILHNHLAPQQKQAECFPATRVMAWDRYPFRLSWPDPLATWAAGINDHVRVARSINANLWVVLQSYSSGDYTPGGNYVHSREISHPLQMKAQAWVAVGQGATGLFVYFYDLYRRRPAGEPGEYTAFKTETGEDTPAYAAWAEALAEITPHAPLLLKLQRQETSVARSNDARVWVTTFRARPGVALPDTYLVAVNADWERARTFALDGLAAGDLQDVGSGARIGAEARKALTLPPGAGRIFRFTTDKLEMERAAP